MADSFADLWNSSAPSKPTPLPQKLGSAPPPNALPKRPQHDVFSMLSSAGSSNPSSRSITPSRGSTSSHRTTTPNPATKPSSNGGDAFSGLLSGSLAAGANGSARMTIAERAAEAERLKLASLRRHQQKVKAPTSDAWDGLDSLGKPSTAALASLSVKPAALVEDDWGLDSFASKPAGRAGLTKPTPPPAAAALVDGDDWLSEFSAQPAARTKPQIRPATPESKPWMLGDEDSAPALPPRRRPNSPGDFDFGNREDALLGDDSHDEDDILGALSKPVDAMPKRKSPPTTNQSSTRSSPAPAAPRPRSRTNGTPSSRPVSPPPHILGQIVEMGFSVQQARVALAATDTGLDVQAALETLLSNGAGASEPSPSPQSPDYHPPRSGARLMERDRDHRTPSPSNSQLDRDQERERERNIQEHADKLLAQASEIGLSVFNKASSFWKEGKERMAKAYVERASASGASSSSSTPGVVGAGRPKWMTEPIGEEGHGQGEDPWKDGLREPAGSFSDEAGPRTTRGARGKPMEHQQVQQKVPEPKPKPKTADLFSDDLEPAAYVSPFRRGKPPSGAASSSSTPAARNTPPPPSRRAPSPVRQRANLVSASLGAIATATKHKDAGSAKFKLGQFAEAESAYTLGLGTLPAGHLLLVSLHNNRAIARLRTGDHAGAIADAGAVIELIGAGYHPSREAKVARAEEGAGVELGDALAKALKRRAEAWEGREKWEEAGRDWAVLAGMEWAGGKVREEAARGAGRCRRMAVQGREGDAGGVRKPVVKPKPKPAKPVKPAALSRPAPPSQALASLRTASDAAEAEEQLRHELKDSVDGKLLAWKGGKETNIRALLGSLDTVLWPELGLQKVGMAELVTPSQVKVKYTKTIAKLHPDKLNAGNTTVEQRMLANGVFGTLNEAWNAFKQ
ncbi:hypothetical protein FPV67DRAFT_1649659 [Lyophyllum atratum]|nr:hypothetical protein FPV67DRAFT_1649659 [Lyophyllum atratum]